MSLPPELQLGLVRLSAELGKLQGVVQQVLESGGSPAGGIGSDDLVAKAQYLALEAAIGLQEGRTARG
ncbi:hypothetical protein J7E49_20785 [Variovorax paradoxus]|nr:hypothetical protein [Variovorax paradoxus]